MVEECIIFENINFENARKQFNGIKEKYFILNSKLKFVNTGSFSEYHNITHTELTFFCKVANLTLSLSRISISFRIILSLLF